MDILKIAIDWAKAEVVSTVFFIAAGIVFALISFGLWQLGKTDLARAYIYPILVAGVFLMTVGVGLFFTNKARITQFEQDYSSNSIEFVTSELDRVDGTLKEYNTIVFTAIPILIILCGVVIYLVDKPIWRASMISVILMLGIILLIDGLAHARINVYKTHLVEAKKEVMNLHY